MGWTLEDNVLIIYGTAFSLYMSILLLACAMYTAGHVSADCDVRSSIK